MGLSDKEQAIFEDIVKEEQIHVEVVNELEDSLEQLHNHLDNEIDNFCLKVTNLWVDQKFEITAFWQGNNGYLNLVLTGTLLKDDMVGKEIFYSSVLSTNSPNMCSFFYGTLLERLEYWFLNHGFDQEDYNINR